MRLPIFEKQDLWSVLKATKKPIYIYGMGDGAEKIMAVLRRREIPIAGIYASDEYVRGHSFAGFRVLSFNETCERHGGVNGFISLLAFATQREPLLTFLYEKGELLDAEMYAPDVPVAAEFDEAGGFEVFDMEFVDKHEEELLRVYRSLSDEQSRRVFTGVLNFKLSGKLSYLKESTTPVHECYDIIKPVATDAYVDLGAFTGDTAQSFLEAAGGARRIIAFEPDKKNYKRLCHNMETAFPSAECFPYGGWSKRGKLAFKGGKGGRSSRLIEVPLEANTNDDFNEVLVCSVDECLNGERADVIKFDVEGAEREAIIGCSNTIKRYHPRLMVSAYHRNEDLFAIPLQILSMQKNYKVYLRHHPYIPAWETNYYFA